MSNNPWLQPEFWKGVVAQLIGLLALVGIIAQPDAQGLQDAGFKAVGGMGICIANAVMVIHYFRHRRQQQGMVEQTAGGLGGPPLVVLAVLCFCGSSPAFVAAQTWPGTGGRPGVVESRGPPPWQLQQPRQAGQANVVDVTVLVRAENRGGSAVVIGRVQSARGYEYLLSTAAHVTERARDVQLTWPGGTVLPGRVVSCNRQDDCALIAAASVQEFPTTRVADNDPQPGQVVWQVGYPSGRRATAKGTTHGIRGGQLQTTVVLKSGDSGGGFFNANGHLVGVSTCSISDGRGSWEMGCGPTASVVRSEVQRCGWPSCAGGDCQGCCPGGICNPFRPRPPSNPKQPAPDLPPVYAPPTAAPPGPDLGLAIQDVQSKIAAIQSKLDGLKTTPGPAGPQGPPGPAGQPGPAGLGADVSRLDALEQRLSTLEKKPQPVTSAPTRIRVVPATP